MDIVEYAEQVCGAKLYDWQKEHLRTLDKMHNSGDIRVVMPKGSGRHQVYIYMNQLKELISNGRPNHS